MAKKDPAFLFYVSDFLTGTMFMNNEQVGIYIRLLCSQHQHGGIIDKISFNCLIGENLIVKSKFIETETGFYNERLTIEMEKRNKKSNNMSEVAKEVWKNRKIHLHEKIEQKQYKSNTKVKETDTIVIQPINVNENININNNIKVNEQKKELIFPFHSNEFINVWNMLVDGKKWKSKTINALQMSLKKLSKYNEPTAIKMIEDCIAGNWQGLVEPKNADERGRAGQIMDAHEKLTQIQNARYGTNNS